MVYLSCNKKLDIVLNCLDVYKNIGIDNVNINSIIVLLDKLEKNL